MRTNSSASTQKTETVGYLLGGLGIAIFSLTYPATKVAVPVFGSWLTTSARAAIAGSLAAIVLAFVRPQLPNRSQWRRILVVSFCVTIGFPLFIALALEQLPASRTAIVTAVLPTATAVIGSIRQRQRPSWQFWAAAFAGVMTVTVFAIASSPNQRPQAADLLLLVAIGFAAVGYTEGAEVSKQIGGWQTISWAVVLALPLTVPATLLLTTTQTLPPVTAGAATGLAYVAVGSNFLGFFAWYAGLSRGGVARVSQIQLLQPLLTLVAAAVLLGETITVAAGVTAAIVVSCVLASRRARIYPAHDSSTNVDAARPQTALASSST